MSRRIFQSINSSGSEYISNVLAPTGILKLGWMMDGVLHDALYIPDRCADVGRPEEDPGQANDAKRGDHLHEFLHIRQHPVLRHHFRHISTVAVRQQ